MQFLFKTYKILSVLMVLFLYTYKLEAASGTNGRIFIEQIRCEGTFKTSCVDLTRLLDVHPKSYISEDELNAITAKLAQIGYYSSYAVALEPLKEPGHANLVLNIVEKPTGRHGILTRGFFGMASIPAFGAYSFSDTNFLGRGHYFSATASTNLSGQLRSLDSFQFEFAAPQGPYVSSLRFFNPKYGSSETIGLVGLGLGAGYNAAMTFYFGNAIGANFTFTTEDNSFIPKEGVKLSATYLHTIFPNPESLFGIDSRISFPTGKVGNYDGVLSFGLVSKPQLNPTFYSFEGQQASNPHPEGGITYSLVTSENDRRSAFYLGAGTAGILRNENDLVIHAGYKAALEYIDLNIGIIIVRDNSK